jgi:sigma-B regulation protein RsbU (phosphoserine phosphatase)
MLTVDGHLTCASAGHNPPLLVREGRIRRLSAGGPMLGVFADARFEEETVRVRAGDGLILFSDGVTEAFNSEGEEFGETRLLTCVAADWHLYPAGLVASVLNEVRQFRGETEQSDDATLMVLRYVDPPNITLKPGARPSTS